MFHPTLLFYIKKAKVTSDGKASIYLRITINAKRAEISLNRKGRVDLWNSEGNSAVGNSTEAYTLNRQLNKIKNDVYIHFQKFTENGEYITAVHLRDAYLGKNKNERMILQIFQTHNDQVEKLVGKEFSAGTAERYRTARNWKILSKPFLD